MESWLSFIRMILKMVRWSNAVNLFETNKICFNCKKQVLLVNLSSRMSIAILKIRIYILYHAFTKLPQVPFIFLIIYF